MSFSMRRGPVVHRSKRTWRVDAAVLYMDANAGNIGPLGPGMEWDSGARRHVRPVCPVTLRSLNGRSNGDDDMDGATIKPPRPGKAPESRPAELDPSEFLAAAVRAAPPGPLRGE